MSVWRYFTVNARERPEDGLPAGTIVSQLPLTGVRCNRARGPLRFGTFTGQLPANHPKADPAKIEPLKHEILAVRDNVPRWNGLLLAAPEVNGMVELTAVEAHWPLWQRTHETDEAYNGSVFSIVLDMLAAAEAKTAGDLYRFTVTSSGSTPTKVWNFSGAGRRHTGQTVDDLAAGVFDYRLLIGGTRGTWTRTLELVAPGVGTAITDRVLRHGRRGVKISVHKDATTAGTRIHVRGAGSLVASQSNTDLLDAGYVLVERVVDRTNVNSQAVLDDTALGEVARLAPPRRTFDASFTPSDALPFDFCDLGDTIMLKKPSGYSRVDAVQRVAEIEMVPPAGSTAEQVILTFDEPAAA